eukprot:Gregarina_sp_Poly_1__1225@NODE_129_length_13257_cov_57_196588_g115_i0_p6_GENE_NODE_129_length_13257_cov_57_196588_g115_i0NODE_129_length_13257_cov_57_196588_g115_i0_p6_ORF_typecomplete_len378_score31_52FWWh/PF14922_6/42FWWh/PF14922_6/1_8FWWh/PF14922_6/3_2e03Erf4/PF10256_9/0_33_NODE_129_length_13257_cov_57_196588_g115_i049106043
MRNQNKMCGQRITAVAWHLHNCAVLVGLEFQPWCVDRESEEVEARFLEQSFDSIVSSSLAKRLDTTFRACVETLNSASQRAVSDVMCAWLLLLERILWLCHTPYTLSTMFATHGWISTIREYFVNSISRQKQKSKRSDDPRRPASSCVCRSFNSGPCSEMPRVWLEREMLIFVADVFWHILCHIRNRTADAKGSIQTSDLSMILRGFLKIRDKNNNVEHARPDLNAMKDVAFRWEMFHQTSKVLARKVGSEETSEGDAHKETPERRNGGDNDSRERGLKGNDPESGEGKVIAACLRLLSTSISYRPCDVGRRRGLSTCVCNFDIDKHGRHLWAMCSKGDFTERVSCEFCCWNRGCANSTKLSDDSLIKLSAYQECPR